MWSFKKGQKGGVCYSDRLCQRPLHFRHLDQVDCQARWIMFEFRPQILGLLRPINHTEISNKGGTAVRFFVHVHELYFCCKYIIWGKGSMGSSGTWQLAILAILHEDWSYTSWEMSIFYFMFMNETPYNNSSKIPVKRVKRPCIARAFFHTFFWILFTELYPRSNCIRDQLTTLDSLHAHDGTQNQQIQFHVAYCKTLLDQMMLLCPFSLFPYKDEFGFVTISFVSSKFYA